ncbi:12480_t:CDS:10 [Entrophospora sp. SA101]|nr:8236_t:CDS:10 [Entrophospora sp. SA101]CAJ0830584.1 12480_t:CDS:10 [Entrophospora sp. SA101]
MRQIEGEIRELTRLQVDDQQGVEEVEQAKKEIEELFERISQIRDKAAQSVVMVQEITQDIKSLDYAKKHLTLSITALKRLQMLVTAVDQLKIMAEMKQYKETSQLLQAVLQLAAFFKKYRNIQQIAVLLSTINTFQNDLKKQIFNDFESSFGTDGSLNVQTAPLDEACMVLDIIGQDVRNQMINWYCDRQLNDYKRKFKGIEEAKHANIFPQHWRLSEVLCGKFCDITKEDLAKILAKIGNELDVKTLLKNLQMTLEFENQLTKRFSFLDKPKLSKTSKAQSSDNGQRYIFNKSISVSYEPYLGLYIESEDKTISNMISSYITEPIPDDDTSVSVLQSSIDLFIFYKESLENCSKLSTRKPLYDLFTKFAKYLRVYANDVLIGRLPREEKRAMSKDELKLICYIINTADYCCVTTSQLEDKLIEKIEEFKEKISLDAERDYFSHVVVTAIKTLIRGIELCYEPALVSMTKIHWGTLESVGDQSEYVTMFQTTLKSCVVSAHKDITNDKYYESFCDKFVESFVSKLISNLSKCKPISEVGAEQMLLDIHALKTTLLEMPTMGKENIPPPSSTFIRMVNKGIGKMEAILKVILTPHDPSDGLIGNYFLLIGDKNLNNFQKILELKGIKKPDQQHIIEIFQQLDDIADGSSGGGGGSNKSTISANKFNESVRKVLNASWRRKDNAGGEGNKKDEEKL